MSETTTDPAVLPVNHQTIVDVTHELATGKLIVWDLGDGRIAAFGHDGTTVAAIMGDRAPAEETFRTKDGRLKYARVISEDDLEKVIAPFLLNEAGTETVRIEAVTLGQAEDAVAAVKAVADGYQA